ncbi:RHOMBOID-like protein 15 [Wolffia australiana]
MRSNIVSEAGLQTRFGQWWGGITFVTSAVLVLCSFIYLVCLLVGYDSFREVCFLPVDVVSHFQVYRIYTADLFHGSLLHVLFNMLALVPLGTELERIIGSVRLVYLIWLLATSNGLLHLIIAFTIAKNPVHPFPYLLNECAIGFSGVLFSLIVIEGSLSGIRSRSVFGLFNVPTKWYPWILLILFQFLASNVSLLGHLCGILSGFAYMYGFFQYVTPGPSFYSAIESSSVLSSCVRLQGFILSSGASHGSLPTYSSSGSSPSTLLPGNVWRNLSSWVLTRQMPSQVSEESRFPGRGRTLGSERGPLPPTFDPDLSLQARLLDDNGRTPPPETVAQRIHDTRPLAVNTQGAVTIPPRTQDSDGYAEEVKKLVSMGFEKTQVEVALDAAEGDLEVAVEILMSQQSH